MERKIKCIEGIRLIACLSVFLCHFKGAFYPQNVWLIDNTPLKIFILGNVWVRILFVISGFVVSYKYITSQKYENIPIDIVKRYFRLMPAVLISNILVYLLMKAGMLGNVYAGILSGSEDFLSIFNNFEPNIGECLKEGLVSTIFNGANAYISPFWTITYEFYGVIVVLCALYVFRNNVIRCIFYIVVFGCFSSYYNYFVLGMLMCEIYVSGETAEILHKNKKLSIALLLIGCMIITMFTVDDNIKSSRVVFALGIMAFFLPLLNSASAEKILGNKFMTCGGAVSFAVYIVHWPIIESFSSYLYIYMYRLGFDKTFSVVVNLVLTLFLVIIVAYVFNKYVERLGVTATKACSKWFLERK